MMPDTTQFPAHAKSAKRRGVVLIAVLVVVVLMALAGYQYADLMLAEYKACESSHRALQAQKFADSGIHYATAMLSNPDNFTSMLNSNPWNNPQMFQGIQLQGDGKLVGYFDIVAPPNIDDTSSTMTPIYGVQDEASKINLNAQMLIDPTGKGLYNMLMTLPYMTNVIAANIVSWMGGSYGISQGGVGDDTYMGLPWPYHCKNAPIDSIDELMLVQGVTWDLLYGSDLNRNGLQEDNELGTYGYWRGWSAFLTVHSREQNYGPDGTPFVYLNNTDLSQLYTLLLEGNVDPSLAKFIVMYRQFGSAAAAATSSGSGSNSNVGTILKNALTGSLVAGNLADYDLTFTTSGKTQFTSIFQLCNAQVSVQTKDDKGNTITTVYPSPVSDVGSQRELLPALFQCASLVQTTQIPARININTAPIAVLTALPSLQASDVQTIFTTRPDPTQGGDLTGIFATPTWLLTEANISLSTLQKLDPYVTTRSQVYRIQSVGYFDSGKGPAIRLEAVIDTNAGRPRILAWRTLSELGRGWTLNGTPAPATNP